MSLSYEKFSIPPDLFLIIYNNTLTDNELYSILFFSFRKNLLYFKLLKMKTLNNKKISFFRKTVTAVMSVVFLSSNVIGSYPALRSLDQTVEQNKLAASSIFQPAKRPPRTPPRTPPRRPAFKIRVVEDPLKEKIASVKRRLSAPIERRTGWVRISATMEEAYHFHHGWQKTTDQTHSFVLGENSFLFNEDALTKAATWFNGNLEFERMGSFLGQIKDGAIQIVDFLPMASYAS